MVRSISRLACEGNRKPALAYLGSWIALILASFRF